MTEAVFDKWVAELRSGNYQQGTGYLCQFDANDKPTYCCLGVLADVLELKGTHELREQPMGTFTKVLAINSFIGSLSPSIIPTHNQIPLVNQNDDGKTFNEIADYLVENKAQYVTQ